MPHTFSPLPPHHRLLPRANSCRALRPNPTAPTLRNPTSHSRHTCHPLPTRLSSLSRRTFHPFVVSTPDISNSSHVYFHDVRDKTFSAHNTTENVPAVRETGLFTHGKATLISKIISMCTPDVAMPCPCCAWQGCAMPPHLRTIGSSRARTLAVPCFPTLNSHPAQSHISLQPHFPSSPYSLSITLPTHIPSLSRLTFHPFVVSTLALSNSSHVSFHGVRTKTFSTHVTT